MTDIHIYHIYHDIWVVYPNHVLRPTFMVTTDLGPIDQR